MSVSDLTDPQPRMAPLITAGADGALLAVGVRIDFRAFIANVKVMDRGGITWMLSLAMAITGYFIVAWAQVEADDIIRTIVRIPPERLADAQKALAAWLTFIGWFVGLCIFAFLVGCIAAASAMSSMLTSVRRGTLMLAGASPAVLAFIYVPVLLKSTGPETTNRALTMVETGVILGASFDTNDPSVDDRGRHVMGHDGVGPICSNVRANGIIAFVTSDAPHPSEVLLAVIDETAKTVSFQVVRCVAAAPPVTEDTKP